jgi:Arc/MetJ-type ribon-helix-helix transcriptional regulator
MASKGKYTTVSIPYELADKAKKHIKDTGFKNLSDYVAFILREIVATKKDWSDAKTDGDRKRVEEKLRSLGYL